MLLPDAFGGPGGEAGAQVDDQFELRAADGGHAARPQVYGRAPRHGGLLGPHAPHEVHEDDGHQGAALEANHRAVRHPSRAGALTGKNRDVYPLFSRSSTDKFPPNFSPCDLKS
eukprot:43814-Pyramimonas_sp.AAC.1